MSKRPQKYLRKVYRLIDETFSEIDSETDFIPEGAELLGTLPWKTLKLYSEKRGFELDREQSRALQDDITHYAWERLLRYLGYRERSIAECRNYLRRLPLSEEITDILVSRAKEKGYLDEERFAELLTRSYIGRHKSRAELKSALIGKRIPSDIVARILDEYYTEEDKKEVLRYHIEKGTRRYPDRHSRKDYQKCIAYLMRKGFSYDDFRDELLLYYRDAED